MVSFRICKTDEWEDCVYYKANCACGNDECNITLDLEAEEYEENEGLKNDTINLNMFSNLYYNSWTGVKENWYCSIISRTKAALRILFTGRIKVSSSFMFRGEKQIEEFINALEEGKEKIKGT